MSPVDLRRLIPPRGSRWNSSRLDERERARIIGGRRRQSLVRHRDGRRNVGMRKALAFGKINAQLRAGT